MTIVAPQTQWQHISAVFLRNWTNTYTSMFFYTSENLRCVLNHCWMLAVISASWIFLALNSKNNRNCCYQSSPLTLGNKANISLHVSQKLSKFLVDCFHWLSAHPLWMLEKVTVKKFSSITDGEQQLWSASFFGILCFNNRVYDRKECVMKVKYYGNGLICFSISLHFIAKF